jgi:ankyrin repeat protein
VATKYLHRLVAAIILAMLAVPAQAQMFSDGFTFLKAVKDRDGDKVTSMIATPGSVLINTRESGSGNGALHILTRERDSVWLGFFLGKGAKPDLQNNQGNTPLALAAQIGWTEGAERLLGALAAVDLANNRGETPLIMAVHNRDAAMVRLLLGAGANPERTDSVAGYSALDYARQDGRSSTILKLIEAKPAPKPVAGPKP